MRLCGIDRGGLTLSIPHSLMRGCTGAQIRLNWLDLTVAISHIKKLGTAECPTPWDEIKEDSIFFVQIVYL